MCRKKCFHAALSASSFQVCQIVGALKGDFSEDLSTPVEDLKKERAEEWVRGVSWESGKKLKNGEIPESDPSEHFSLPNWNRNHSSVSTFFCFFSCSCGVIYKDQVQCSLPVQCWGSGCLPFPLQISLLSLEKMVPP